jgi:hypothetical protein
MSSLKCPYCPRTFSSKSGYTQHVKCCASEEIVSDNESDLITDINDMSLDSEELNRNIEKVKKTNEIKIFF